MDIEKLAREAGVVDYGATVGGGFKPALERFAALVVEECAKVAEDMRSEPQPYCGELEYRVAEKAYEVAQDCASAIRAQVPPQSDCSAK